jgi:hypothetical protein
MKYRIKKKGGVNSKKGLMSGFFLSQYSFYIPYSIRGCDNCHFRKLPPGYSNHPTPHTHSVGGSVTVNAKTTVYCSPDSSMVPPKQETQPYVTGPAIHHGLGRRSRPLREGNPGISHEKGIKVIELHPLLDDLNPVVFFLFSKLKKEAEVTMTPEESRREWASYKVRRGVMRKRSSLKRSSRKPS